MLFDAYLTLIDAIPVHKKVGRQNPGAFSGTTKETKTPFWHLLDPRFERLNGGSKWPTIGLKWPTIGLKWLIPSPKKGLGLRHLKKAP